MREEVQIFLSPGANEREPELLRMIIENPRFLVSYQTKIEKESYIPDVYV